MVLSLEVLDWSETSNGETELTGEHISSGPRSGLSRSELLVQGWCL